MTNLTPADLTAFEADIAAIFNTGTIKAPIHLAGGNEQQLIDYFQNHYDATRGDWICTAWRSHFHCLLAGVPPTCLKADILAGRSITLTYPDHHIVSSAIVGGILPIALGLALAMKRQNSPARVHAFVGDMTATTGVYRETKQYAMGHGLPLSLIVEDNGKSVGTPTTEAWGDRPLRWTPAPDSWETQGNNGFRELCYAYILPWPHAGSGTWIKF